MSDLIRIAFSIANDEQQAEFINTAARELFVRCGGRGRGVCTGYENQVCMISAHINDDGRQFIKDLHEFLELREKDMSR